MKNSIYRITLDMHDVASQVQITAKQHDTARKLHITLMENGKPYSIEEGCRAVLSINRPGSTVINDDCEIKMNGSVIMYDFNSPTTEVLGINECEVKLYDPDGDIITSPRFTLLVDENVYNDGDAHGIDHSKILNRDKNDQHPIKAITGLEKELESKANAEKIYAEIALDRSRIDNIAALGQNSVIEVQKKYNTTGDTTPLTFSLVNDGKCVVIIYYYKSAPNTETYSSSVLVNSQSIFTKTLDGAAGTYLEEVEFDGKAGDIVTITRDNVNVSINSVLYVTNKSTDTELADIRLGADGTIYPCAGDAVREQVSALKDDVDSQVGALKKDIENQKLIMGITSNNVIKSDFFKFTLWGMYNTSGKVTSSTTYAYTEMKPICKESVITVPNIGVEYIIGIATYKKDKTFIKRLPNVSYAIGGKVVLDSDVEYVAFNFGIPNAFGRSIVESDLSNFEIKISTNNSVYRLIDEIYDNALKHGFVNDGETDNSTAFTNYLEKHKDGFRLFFPSGIYCFSQEVSIDGINNFVIDGDGTLKLADGVYTGTTEEAIYFLRVMNCENINIKNITINGNKTNNHVYYYGTSADALTFDNCRRICIDNVKVIDPIDSGIYVTNSAGVHITKCRLVGSRTVIDNITFSVSGSIVTVNGSFESNVKGKYVWLTSGSYCVFGVITDVSDSSITCKAINVYGRQTANDCIVNVFNSDSGIYLNNCINSDGLYVEDNYVFAFSIGIHCNRGCSHLKISNNNIHNCVVGMDLTTFDTTDGVSYKNPSKNIITSNQFTVDAVGIACRIAENTVISNNYIQSNIRGIELAGCNSVIASGNMIVGIALGADSYAGIVLSKGRKDGVIYKTDYAVLNDNILNNWYNGIRKNIEATNIVIADGNGFNGIKNNNISDGDIE